MPILTLFSMLRSEDAVPWELTDGIKSQNWFFGRCSPKRMTNFRSQFGVLHLHSSDRVSLRSALSHSSIATVEPEKKQKQYPTWINRPNVLPPLHEPLWVNQKYQLVLLIAQLVELQSKVAQNKAITHYKVYQRTVLPVLLDLMTIYPHTDRDGGKKHRATKSTEIHKHRSSWGNACLHFWGRQCTSKSLLLSMSITNASCE